MNLNSDPAPTKRRRIQRACDRCRSRKVKCKAGDEIRCANCIQADAECTHTPSKKRGPKSRIHMLQSSNQYTEGDASATRARADSSKRTRGNHTCSQDVLDGIYTSSMFITDTLEDPESSGSETESGEEQDEDFYLDLGTINQQLRQLSMGLHDHRYFGQSSSFLFLRRAVEAKKLLKLAQEGRYIRRDELWRIQQWELASLHEPQSQHQFPEPELLQTLVDIYFERINLFFPLLHRPTFNRDFFSGLHFTDRSFGGLVLLVAASGSKFSQDTRVFEDGCTDPRNRGWKWFSQVRLFSRALIAMPTLFEVQTLCLAAWYLQGLSTPQTISKITGTGLRLAEERGIHRRKPLYHRWTPEDELWKRAFWILLSHERHHCSAVGRPISIHEEDMDVELPFICDDEYWEYTDTNKIFKQPEGKPSIISYFVAYLRLGDILAFILRTIYAVPKFKASLAKANPSWESETVAKIDSALNKWMDLVPEFLRWSPNQPRTPFFYQAASLQVFYHYLRIQAHRPFGLSANNTSALSPSSLTICVHAARSCSHIFAEIYHFPAIIPDAHFLAAAFVSCVSLFMYIWDSKASNRTIDREREMRHINDCLRYLQTAEPQYQAAGRFVDILTSLIAQEELSLPPNAASSEVDAPLQHLTRDSTPSGPATLSGLFGENPVALPNWDNTSINAEQIIGTPQIPIVEDFTWNSDLFTTLPGLGAETQSAMQSQDMSWVNQPIDFMLGTWTELLFQG